MRAVIVMANGLEDSVARTDSDQIEFD